MLRSRPTVAGFRAMVAALAVALLLPAGAFAYGWPVAPFDAQHAIRGAFHDPPLGVRRGGRAAGARLRLGDARAPTDGTVAAYDAPPLAPPPPGQDARWTPALVRWRLQRDGGDATPWRTAADFRTTWLPPVEFGEIYATGTTQNRPWQPGRYVFWLPRGPDTPQLPNREYPPPRAPPGTPRNTRTAPPARP